MGLTMTGIKEMNIRLRKQVTKEYAAAATALYQTATEIMDESIILTPIVSGRLRSSAYVNQPVISPGHISVTFGYNEEIAPYALVVHERIYGPMQEGGGRKKVYHAPPTQAKFLETALLHHEPGFQASIDAKIAVIMGL